MAGASSPTSTPSPRRSRWQRWGSWISGLLILAAIAVGLMHRGEIERFVQLITHIRPVWIAGALGLQAATYLCIAGVWYLALRESGHPRPLRELTSLGFAQLFTDQVVPSGGISGTALMLSALSRRGVPSPIGMGALMVELLSHYGAYLIVVLVSFALLWIYHDLNPTILIGLSLFVVIVVGIPAGILALKHSHQGTLPTLVLRIPGIGRLVENMRRSPAGLLSNRRLSVQSVVLQTLIFVLDAATLWMMLRAIGQTTPPSAAFASYVLASAVATLGPIPIGPFEATSVTALGVLGVPLGAAFTATLLLRGLTFWLPMLPGLWLARREVAAANDRQ